MTITKFTNLVYFTLFAGQLAISLCYTVNRTTAIGGNGTIFSSKFKRIKGSTSPQKEDEGDFYFYYKLADALRNSTEVPVVNRPSNSSTNLAINTTTEAPDPRLRIIGGEPAIEGEFKYQLSIRRFNRHHCGASLITVEGEQVGLTAAHCLRGALADDLVLVAGDLTRSDRSGNEQARQVIDIARHENFEFIEGVPSYDIALLFIETPFTENNFVGNIALPKKDQEIKGKVVVSGWGDDNPRYGGRPSDRLMKVEVPIVEHRVCKSAYSFIIDDFADHFVCAGYMMPGVAKDSCQGDSGGPVRSVDERGAPVLVGIISWGAGCGLPSFPGVNTKVSYFTDWIDKQVIRYKTDSSSEEDDSSREEEEEGEDNDNDNNAKGKRKKKKVLATRNSLNISFIPEDIFR